MFSQMVLAASILNITSIFGPHLSPQAEIIPSSKTGFPTQLQQRWTDYNAPSYSIGAIKPSTDQDIQHIVKIANSHNLPYFVTGGGHGISDYHSFDGLAIDLSQFKSVQFSHHKSRVTIGGSVKIKDLIKPLYEAGRELPLGSCACVGVVGATLGGGIGGLQGRHGLMADALESVRIITADGKLLTASEHEHADLFWAIRGAGANFGIVSSATYKLPKMSNHGQYLNADFMIPVSQNLSFFSHMESLDHDMPDRLAINAGILYNRETNEPMIAINVVYYGSEKEGRQHVKPFAQLLPIMSNITMVPADDAMDAAFFRSFGKDNGACTPNQHINIYSMALKSTDVPTFDSFFHQLVKFWEDNPGFQGRWLLQKYSPKGMQKHAPTAFGYRDAKLFMNFEGFYDDVGLDDKVNDFLTRQRSHFAKESGYEHLAVYSNYARGDEGVSGWYGSQNVKKLSAIKKKYDPEQRFSVHNPVS